MTPEERASSVRASLKSITDHMIALKTEGFDPRITGLNQTGDGRLSPFRTRGESLGLDCKKSVVRVETI